MPFFSRPQHGRLSTAVLCCGLEKNGMVGAWHGHGMASVNQTRDGRAVAFRRTTWSEDGMGMAWHQTRPHCVDQMGKTHSKLLAAGHGMGTAWARHGNGMLYVNRPLETRRNAVTL